MAKRKLTRRQAWQIQKVQQERLKRQEKKLAKTTPETDNSKLGPEQGGRIIANYGATLIVEDDHGHTVQCHPRANMGSIVVGDQIVWQTVDKHHGVVSAVEPRESLLERPVQHGEPKPVAANIDQIYVVVAPEPTLQTVLIDRYLVATELADINAAIVVNKVELLNVPERQELEDSLKHYLDLDYPLFYISTKTGEGMAELARDLRDKTSILAGQSGVGKSSTINALLPDLDIQTGRLSEGSNLGRHTTSASKLYHLARGGAIIDSPGVRDFGLWQIARDKLTWGFKEFRPHLGRCKFSNCSHEHEPECALREAIDRGEINKERLINYRKIIDLTSN